MRIALAINSIILKAFFSTTLQLIASNYASNKKKIMTEGEYT